MRSERIVAFSSQRVGIFSNQIFCVQIFRVQIFCVPYIRVSNMTAMTMQFEHMYNRSNSIIFMPIMTIDSLHIHVFFHMYIFFSHESSYLSRAYHSRIIIIDLTQEL